jgi:hypothetical protein
MRPTALAALLLMLATGAAAKPQVEISFAKSSFADFLFYVLDRNVGPYEDLSRAVPLSDVPTFEGSSFLPQAAILSHVSQYRQLYEHVAEEDDHVRLTEILHKAEPHYAAFYSYWRMHISPQEDRVEREWRLQNRNQPPVAKLEELERLSFPFSTIKVDLMALQPQGSSMQGPPTIFTTLAVPSLAWAVGHEGTHMMLGPKGADWRSRPNGAEAAARMKAAGGSEYDVEEALCLLMQAKLSIAAGMTPQDYRTSAGLKASPRKTLLLALERDWTLYLDRPGINAADWLIEETARTFPAAGVAR